MNSRTPRITQVALSLILLFTLFSISIAFAATYQLSGRVTDQSGNPVSNTLVEVIDPITDTLVISTTTSTNGNYVLSLDEGTYDVRYVPPTGSGFAETIAPERVIVEHTILDIILVPAGITSLSGRLLDATGAPILSQRIQLSPVSGSVALVDFTDADGNYSFNVTPGDYNLRVEDDQFVTNAPRDYFIDSTESLSLTQNTVMDITLPTKQVSVLVQDPAGNPVPNVQIYTNYVYNYALTLGTVNAYGRTGYPSTSTTVSTDSNGQAVLWLFPTSESYTYQITAVPPSTSPFATFYISEITVTSEKTIAAILQFVHLPPSTTAVFEPLTNTNDTYPGPVTVTLSATATSGYIVDATYYRIDGGPEQLYTAPFVISGDGIHTISYWSVDNFGVYETPRTQTFEIASLLITTDSPLPSGTVGFPYEVTLEASGGTLPYIWSVVSGALPPGLILDPETGTISGTPTTAGTFAFTIQVEDSSNIATKEFGLAPPPPSGEAGSEYEVPVIVTDPTPGAPPPTCDNYEIIAGTLPDGLTLDPNTGVISGTPTDGGTYNVTIACVIIETGQTANKDFTITINNPLPTLTSLDPASRLAESDGFMLTLQGTNFVQSSVVNWNGSPRATTYLSATELQAAILASDIVLAGTAELTVTNPDPVGGTSNAIIFNITPPNQLPTVDAGGPYTVPEGSTVTVTAVGDDPDGDFLTYAWDLNNNGSYETVGQSVTFSAADLDGPGSLNIAVQVTDPGGLFAMDTAAVTIENVAPTAYFTLTASVIDEGQDIMASFANVQDPSVADTAAGFLYSYDCESDGLFEASEVAADNYACHYADEGAFTVLARIQDKDGGATDYTANVTVNNVAPTVGPITAQLAPVLINTEISVSADYSDPGVLDTLTAVWDWGDGSSEVTPLPDTNGTVAATHTYTATGVYIVTLTVTDSAGDSGTAAFEYIVVYDPAGGATNGSGWFFSPPDSYSGDPALNLKGRLGFVVSYRRFLPEPSGNFRFTIQPADVHLNGAGFDWLVVSGTTAIFQGYGTLDGSGDYGFVVTVRDYGETNDVVRVRIWNRQTGEVLYDSQPGNPINAAPIVPLEGGNVTVYTN